MRYTLQPVEFDPFADLPALPGPGFATSPAAPAEPVPTGEPRALPLTATQRELAAAVLMGDEAHCAFNLVYVLQLRGHLNGPAMRQALAAVVHRHAALRTALSDDGASQVVQPQVAVDLMALDLGGLDEAQLREALDDVVDVETHTPFDLTAAPLWRARVLSHPDGRHWLVFSIHHLVSDGWSSAVIFNDWAAAYGAAVQGQANPWPEALPYDAFVQALQAPAARQRAADDEAYWLARHTPPAEPVNLPVDRARPPLKTFACGHVEVPLDGELVAAVRQMGARHGCTFFVTLLAACQGLVARLAGQRDVVLGVPMAFQTELPNAHVVADGAHTVPLRSAVDIDRPFAEHLAVARRDFLDAQSHALLTFGNLVPRMKLARDPSRTPLVDIIFNIDRIGAPFRFVGLDVERVLTPKVFSNSELSINVIDRGRDAIVECHHNAAVYDGGTVRRWLTLYHDALARLVREPGMVLADAFAPGHEERALLASFNQTATPLPPDVRIESLFEAQVLAAPQAIAIRAELGDWTYARLDATANGVAQALVDSGLRSGEFVGLSCGRHPAMVAALYGILKAGAAYVPLDPSYPAERLAHMVQDAGLRIVVGDSASLQHEALAAALPVDLATCHPQDRPPLIDGVPSDIAYVIYTSGSTGRPKGVAVAHASLVNFVTSVMRHPGMTPADRFATVTTLSFDMSVLDMFVPLAAGASLIIMTRDDVLDGHALLQRLGEQQATLMQATPSVWRLLIDAGWQGTPGFRVFVGGEALPLDLAQALLERSASVWNFYGPTETTVYSTLWQVPPRVESIRVGQPIANTQIHVMDAQLRPLPLGVVGEICIGGDGVSQGYLNRRELTSERFPADPARPGFRLYRTGDLGRWHADGTLECLGRMDHQVKIRGYRIELGEIESHLLAVEGIERALVVKREDRPGDPRLVAYLVSRRPDLDVRALKERLRRGLPEFMIPSHFVCLPSLPLLPNGKLDRQALPPPVEAQAVMMGAATALAPHPAPAGTDTGAAPRPQAPPPAVLDPQQEAVAVIWRRLLGVQRIEPHDNFFDLGGHSLLAAQASLEIERALGHRVGVPRLVMESLAQVARPGAAAPAARPQAPGRGGWLRKLTGGLLGG